MTYRAEETVVELSYRMHCLIAFGMYVTSSMFHGLRDERAGVKPSGEKGIPQVDFVSPINAGIYVCIYLCLFLEL